MRQKMDNRKRCKQICTDIGQIYQDTYSCYMDYRLLIYFVDEIVPITYIYEMMKIQDQLTRLMKKSKSLKPEVLESKDEETIQLYYAVRKAQNLLKQLYRVKIQDLMESKNKTEEEQVIDSKYLSQHRGIHAFLLHEMPYALPEMFQTQNGGEKTQSVDKKDKSKMVVHQDQSFWRNYQLHRDDVQEQPTV